MNKLLLVSLVLSSTAHAQVIECPKLFPSNETAFSEVSLGKTGAARVQRGHLSHAYMYFGELYGEQFFTPPVSKKVKGVWDAKYTFSPEYKNWLVCTYGGDAWGGGTVERWERLDPKITSCLLKVRQVKEPQMQTVWKATADCKQPSAH